MNRKTAVVLASVVVAGFALTTGVVAAGDTPALVYPESEEQTAAPGETVEVDVRLSSHGGAGDVGVTSVSLVVNYDPEKLAPVDVTPATWLEQGDETEVETETTTEEGRVVVDQQRDPPAGGAVGDDRFATVTFVVDDDATVGNTSVRFSETDVRLTNDFIQPVFETNATVEITDEPADSGTPVGMALIGAVVAGLGVVALVGFAISRRE